MPGAFFIACALLAGITTLGAAEKPRIYVTESGVTEIEAENINLRKGTSPENIEVMKSFLKKCPGVVVTRNRDKADYIVRFDRESPSPITPFVKGNKVAVFDHNDDLVYSDSTRYLSSAVKSTCSAMLKHAASGR
ncbi:MAG: hypothetical protein ACRD7E_28030 [Bryobacteraceae bacterium]